MSRYRNWCFTINHPTNDEIELCDTIKCDYIVFGYEVGAEGTPHLQGYIELPHAKTQRSVKKSLGGRCHVENRKGTAIQASGYCKEDGLFIERGKLSEQGKRTDLENLADIVKTKGVKGIIEERPDAFIKYGRNIERLAELLMVPRTEKPNVTWIWGLTGTGKTRSATNLPEGKEYYMWNQSKWWNGYRQQHRIIIDDFTFDGTQLSFRYLLRLLDRYAIQVETKGGMLYINSPEIFITCEFPPSHWFEEGNQLDQVLRRINTIEELKAENVELVFEDELEL